MKKTPLLILVGITVISSLIAGLLLSNTKERFSPSSDKIGDYLITGFDDEMAEEILIKDKDNEVVLNRKGDKWVVGNRQSYPIDNPNEIDALLEALGQFRIGIEILATKDHFAPIGVLDPADKEKAEAYMEKRREAGEVNPADPRGLRIAVTGAGGAKLIDLIVGREFGDIASRTPGGFVVRSSAGNAGIWKAIGSLTRRTGEAESKESDKSRGQMITEAKAWLAYKFIEVAKIKSITLSAPNDKEFKGWTVTRPDENAEFSTGTLKADEEMDPAGTSAFKTLFKSMRFEDVLDPAEAEKKKDSANARRAVITTFDDFTYTFDLTPMKPEEAEDEDSPPPPASNYIGTVKIESKLPPERTKAENETPEAAANADKLFAATQENLKYKIEQEKAFEAYTYEFAEFSISSLNKALDEIVKKKDPPSENGDTKPSSVSPPISIPGRPSATTPAIPVPPPNRNK